MGRPRAKRIRAEKPELPEEAQFALEDGDFKIKVTIEISSTVSDFETRFFGKQIIGTIFFSSLAEDYEIPIGTIDAWQFRPYSSDLLMDWADDVDEYLYDSLRWLLTKQSQYEVEEMFLCSKPILIKTVKIEPVWRGRGFTLLAVATFLDLLDAGFVFLQPHPVYDAFAKLPRESVLKREIKALTRYWKMLGFTECEPKYKSRAYIAGYWKCPEWLYPDTFYKRFCFFIKAITLYRQKIE